MVFVLLAPWCNLSGFIPSNPPGGQNLLSSLFSPVFPLPAENGLFSKLISTPPAYPPPARLPSVVIIVVSIFNPIFRSSCCYRRFSQFCAFLPDSSNARHPHIWHSARSCHYAPQSISWMTRCRTMDTDHLNCNNLYFTSKTNFSWNIFTNHQLDA